MRKPFGRLMDELAFTPIAPETPLGELSERFGEPVDRIMDALDAIKERRGERSYVPRSGEPLDGTGSQNSTNGGPPQQVWSLWCDNCHTQPVLSTINYGCCSVCKRLLRAKRA